MIIVLIIGLLTKLLHVTSWQWEHWSTPNVNTESVVSIESSFNTGLLKQDNPVPRSCTCTGRKAANHLLSGLNVELFLYQKTECRWILTDSTASKILYPPSRTTTAKECVNITAECHWSYSCTNSQECELYRLMGEKCSAGSQTDSICIAVNMHQKHDRHDPVSSKATK